MLPFFYFSIFSYYKNILILVQFINKTERGFESYMSAVIIDGKQVAADVRAEVAAKVAELKGKGVAPCLAVILVG